MYGAHDDPYVYPGTHILKNIEDIKDAAKLEAFETEVVTVRSTSGVPIGNFDAAHYSQIHYHLFQDVYAWAGDYRTIRIAKGGNWFCYPENISAQMTNVFATLESDDYLKNMEQRKFASSAAILLSDLNAIHPFRDGNGRAQLTLLSLLSEKAGHEVNLETLEPKVFLNAMIKSFAGDLDPLKHEIIKMLS